MAFAKEETNRRVEWNKEPINRCTQIQSTDFWLRDSGNATDSTTFWTTDTTDAEITGYPQSKKKRPQNNLKRTQTES